MSTKANPADMETLASNDPLMDEFERGQRSSRVKGIVALCGVAVAVAILFYSFVQMATV